MSHSGGYVRSAHSIDFFGLCKALPSRPPETVADKITNKMHTAGKLPLPVEAPQSKSGTYCPACGHSHKLGSICENNNKIAALLTEGNRIIKGNPGHDKATGRFAAGGSGIRVPTENKGGRPKTSSAATVSGGQKTSPSEGSPTEVGSSPSVDPYGSTQVATVPNTTPGSSPSNGSTVPGTAAAKRGESATPTQQEFTPDSPSSHAMNQGVAAYHDAYGQARSGGMEHGQAHAHAYQHANNIYDQVLAQKQQERLAATPTMMKPSPFHQSAAGEPVGATSAPTSDTSAPTIGRQMTEAPASSPSPVPSPPEDVTATPKNKKTPGVREPKSTAQESGGIQLPSMYGAGQAVGAGMWDPGGAVQPSIGLVRQASHSLLPTGGSRSAAPFATATKPTTAPATPQAASPMVSGKQATGIGDKTTAKTHPPLFMTQQHKTFKEQGAPTFVRSQKSGLDVILKILQG